jgi:hypothetical protein
VLGWRLLRIALLLTFGASVAGAEERDPRKAEPFRLVWSSSAGCGHASAFLAELSARTTLLRESQADEHAITLIVETFPAPTGVRGQLTVRKPDGDLSVREVPGQNCEEVQSAMALIAALMVDPLAAGGEALSQSPSPRPAAPGPDVSPIRAEADWSLRVEQRLTARTAIAPDLTWGQGFAGMLTWETSGVRPSLGLSAQIARATTSAPQGRAELDWAASQLSICPLGFAPNRAWDFRTCAVLQVGRLRGVGFQTQNPATKSIIWSSAGLELQARYSMVGPLWLGGEGALTLPFSRERFYFDPDHTLHRVPAWGLSFGLGSGLHFF